MYNVQYNIEFVFRYEVTVFNKIMMIRRLDDGLCYVMDEEETYMILDATDMRSGGVERYTWDELCDQMYIDIALWGRN